MKDIGRCLTDFDEIPVFTPVYAKIGMAYIEGVVFNYEAGRQLNKEGRHVTVLITIEGVSQEKVVKASDVFLKEAPAVLNYGAYLALVD